MKLPKTQYCGRAKLEVGGHVRLEQRNKANNMKPLASFVREVMWSELNLNAFFCPLCEAGFEHIALEAGKPLQ